MLCVLRSVDMVLVGADAVVENGGIINKLGTYQVRGRCVPEQHDDDGDGDVMECACTYYMVVRCIATTSSVPRFNATYVVTL